MNKSPDNNDIVILELDRPRELKLSHKVLKRFCAATGSRLSDIDNTVDDYDNMTMLIYYMLLADDPDLTPEKLDDLLDDVPIGIVLKKGAEAIKKGFGEPEKAESQDNAEDPLAAK